MCTHKDNPPEIYEIPEWNMNLLRKKIDQLNKRANKLDCPHLRIVHHGKKQKVHPSYRKRVNEGLLPEKKIPTFTTHIVTIDGPEIKLAGWKFVGTLDHYTLPGTVIVNAVPGQSVPKEFHHNDAVCDHCGKIRRRVETFVVENENGEFKQVGRQCLKDFLGHNPTAMLHLLRSISALYADLGSEDGEFYGFGGLEAYNYNQVDVLERTCAIIRTHGWISRSRAQDEERATADDVLDTYHPPKGGQALEHWNHWMNNVIKWDKEADRKEAEAAIEWLKEQPSNNEYMHNLHAIAEADHVPAKLFGYWCSLMAAYQREMDKLREQRAQNRVNEWVGEIKERRDFTVNVLSINYADGYYGTVEINKFIDDNGRTLVWFANTDSGMEKGHTYHITGTVKKHDKFNGWKQTIITRVKVKEEIENEEAA